MPGRPRQSSLRLGLFALLLGLAAATCDSPIDVGYPLEISLTADPITAAEGETISFRYEARGRFLVGVVVGYGDGAVDSVRTSGSQQAAGNLPHAFAAEGTYAVTAEVVQGDGARATASTTVEITPASTQDR